jgi:hypothetical protein
MCVEKKTSFAMAVRQLRLRSVHTVEGAADDCHCTLVTQCSLDRLDRLVAQALHWPGSLSAAVLAFDGASGTPVALGVARERVRAAVERIGATARAGLVRIALFDEERRGAADEEGLLRLYPINALRNAALDQVRSPARRVRIPIFQHTPLQTCFSYSPTPTRRPTPSWCSPSASTFCPNAHACLHICRLSRGPPTTQHLNPT